MPGRSLNGGAHWVLGTTNADTFPTNGQGGGDATATNSALHGAREVILYGIHISVVGAAASLASACDAAGTAIPGLTVDAATSGWKPFGNGVTYRHATNANVGIELPATAVGTLFYMRDK